VSLTGVIRTQVGALRERRERARRRRFLDDAIRNVTGLVVAHPAGLFALPAGDLTVTHKLVVKGYRGEFAILARALEVIDRRSGARRRGTFLDVGANMGTTTLAALCLHSFERAVAIEGHTDVCRYLRATVALNGLQERIAVVEAAVGERLGMTEFARHRAKGPGAERYGTGRLMTAGTTQSAIGSVPLVTLDSLVADGVLAPSEVDLTWIDIQGYEPFAFAGGGALLEAGAPIVTAYRPHRLAETGGFDRFHEIVRRRYATFVDLRERDGAAWRLDEQPIDALVALETRRGTDVLLLA
jgi:FkbM family methyltransferase